MPNFNTRFESEKKMKIAVAGTGYVGLSLAVLLSQHNEVHALDIVPEKVEKINNFVSPIQDEEIERFLAEAEAGERQRSNFDRVCRRGRNSQQAARTRHQEAHRDLSQRCRSVCCRERLP